MRKRSHRAQPAANFLLGNFQIVGRLQVEPVLRRLAEGAADEERKLRCYRPRAIDDVRNPHG